VRGFLSWWVPQDAVERVLLSMLAGVALVLVTIFALFAATEPLAFVVVLGVGAVAFAVGRVALWVLLACVKAVES
jgi:uncharacterized membrane protein YbhN (UPF0104 family)